MRSHLAWGALGGFVLAAVVVIDRVDSWVTGQGVVEAAERRVRGVGGEGLAALEPRMPTAVGSIAHALLPDGSEESDLAALLDAEAPAAPSRVDAATPGQDGLIPHVGGDRLGGNETIFGFDFQRRGGPEQRPRPTDGDFLEHYADGALAVEGEYVDGQRAGDWKSWHAEGAVQLEGQYEAGQRVGRWKAYHPNGQPFSEGQYQNGEREGLWVVYYSNGQVKEQGLFEDGLRNGPWLFFDRFGQTEPRTGLYRFGRRISD